MSNLKQRNLQFRCSSHFLNVIGPARNESEKTNRQQLITVALWGFLSRPNIYSKLEIKALREPLTHSVAIQIPDTLYIRLVAFASQARLSMSEVIRMALYQEVVSIE